MGKGLFFNFLKKFFVFLKLVLYFLFHLFSVLLGYSITCMLYCNNNVMQQSAPLSLFYDNLMTSLRVFLRLLVAMKSGCGVVSRGGASGDGGRCPGPL